MSLQKDQSPLIVFRNLSKIYGMGASTVRALDGVDLEIRKGEFVAVMGPSGSGKSTAMNVIGCLDTPTSGDYFFLGRKVSDFNRLQLALLRRNYFGFVFQGFNLLARTSAIANVELPLIYQGIPRAERIKRARAALHHVGLEGRESHTPSQLSGGQQQRVAVARAIVSRPSIILADEPTGNLDSARSREIMDLLSQLNQDDGITIIMVTHEPEMASYAGRTINFIDGKVLGAPTPAENTNAV